MNSKFKNSLSIKNMLALVYSNFKAVPEIQNGRKNKILTIDCLMSGLALFSLKFPSMLKFEKSKKEDKTLIHNLKYLFKIKDTISDTQVRARLDQINICNNIRKPFKTIFAKLQRNNILKQYKYINGTYLLANDATGVFSSKSVHCENCCQKTHKKDNSVTYYHNMLCGAIVKPGIKEVIPLAPEPIIQQDGNTKNDCELNAIKRYLIDVRREHPHLPITVVEDALYANAPHIEILQSHNMHYIIMAKQANHQHLFDLVAQAECKEHEEVDAQETKHSFKYINNVELNCSNKHVLVNFLEYWETKKSGKKQHFAWITDHEITDNNVFDIVTGGRARWHIENETFNTLKNQGYQFEHNFGHGYKNLSTLLTMLMLIAFLIDQVQSLCCQMFNEAKNKMKKKSYLWERIRNIFQIFLIKKWEELFNYIIYKPAISLPVEDSS